MVDYNPMDPTDEERPMRLTEHVARAAQAAQEEAGRLRAEEALVWDEALVLDAAMYPPEAE